METSYFSQLEKLYVSWKKYDKAEFYSRKLLDAKEREFGPNSKFLVDSLQSLADVETKLGHTDEANHLQKRTQDILAPTP